MFAPPRRAGLRIGYAAGLRCVGAAGVLVLLAWVPSGCEPPEHTGSCKPNARRCAGAGLERCAYGIWLPDRRCELPTPRCLELDGVADCRACVPGQPACLGSAIYACTSSGSLGELTEQCPAEQICTDGYCGLDPCRTAELTASYIGCRYLAVPTINPELDAAFDGNFAVAVHNANPAAATVTITRSGDQVTAREVAPGALEVFELPTIPELKLSSGVLRSVRLSGGAYLVSSSRPVTVYQFNPLDYYQAGVYSYTNDAALLLPVHVLSTHYIAMARSTSGVSTDRQPYLFSPGFLAVVGTENNTTVSLTLTAHTRTGTGVQEGAPGQVQTYNLNGGDVLQILSALPTTCVGRESSDDCNGLGPSHSCTYCDQGPAYDLTGTSITASAPVAVFSGHACAFVPYGTWACDHLEEQMIPLEAWGKAFIVGRTEPQHAPGYAAEPNVVRVVSGADANRVRFDPPQAVVGAEVTLARGAWVEFETWGDFTVDATAAVMIGQFLVGQGGYSPPDSVDFVGDPAYALMVPVEQFRRQYSFYAPATIPHNYVTIIAPVGEGSPVVYLDNAPVNADLFTPSLSGTGFGVARVPITGAAHEIHAEGAFGILVYGFASYTSYSYPGGLDLRHINPVD